MTSRRWLLALGVPAAAAVVWLASSELPLASRAWTALLLSALPAVAILQAGMIEEVAEIPRTAIYWSSIASLWLLAVVTAGVMAISGSLRTWPGFELLPPKELVGWTVVTTLAALLLVVGAHSLGLREAPLLRYLLPHTRKERQLFIGLSLTAGFCEELIFRAFLITTLLTASGSLTLAVLLSSGVFGTLHAYQRPAGAVRAAALGAVLAAPLLATGSILPAMFAHAAIDIIAGLWLRETLLR